MNRNEHLLSCLAEECAEVAQQVSKALRFGLADTSPEALPGQAKTNRERLVAELVDLLAVVDLLELEGILELPRDPQRLEAKKARVLKYMEHARRTGALEAD